MRLRQALKIRKTSLRLALAAYFIFFYVQMWHLPADLFSGAANFPSVIGRFFPQLILGTFSLKVLAAGGCVAAILLAFGRWQRVVALFMWIGLVLFLAASSLIRELQFDYLGFLLIGITLYGNTFFSRKNVREVLLLTLGLSYSYSGFYKLMSGDWLSGGVLYTLEPFFRADLFAKLFLGGLIWPMISLQCLALLGVVFQSSAKLTWILLTVLQLGILLSMRLEHITIPVLIFHAACFDPRWLSRRGVSI